jgi:hypothetical protein
MTFEQFLKDRGELGLAAEWRYRDTTSPVASIHGERDGAWKKHDIRDFTARMVANEIQYFSRFDPDHFSFTDRGHRIDVWKTQDEAAVLAALQLGQQKWGTLTITGPAEFKHLCAQLAAQHGFKIRNPELGQPIVSGLGDQKPTPAIPTTGPSLNTAYRMHKADILNRIEVRNGSQLDWMIAVRMRVTGHYQQAIAQALKENASQGRESENRNWTNYGERTAEAVFGPRGDRESARSEQRAEAWARVEGRDPERERQKDPVERPSKPQIERESGDCEYE